MKRWHLGLIVLVSMVPSVGLAQTAKPQAAVKPIGALGDVGTVDTQIIFNRLLSVLSDSYALIPQKRYLEAEEAVFQQIAVEQCTEEKCIRLIQEFLQVERLFIIQLLKTKDFAQLTVTLFTADRKIVKEDSCKGCGVSDLHGLVAGLVQAVSLEDLGIVETVQETGTPLGSWRWKWASSLALGLLSGYYASSEYSALGDSNTEQERLLAELETITDQDEYDQTLALLRSKATESEDHKSNGDAGAFVSVVLLGLATWIYLDPPEPSSASAIFVLPPRTDESRWQLVFRTTW